MKTKPKTWVELLHGRDGTYLIGCNRSVLQELSRHGGSETPEVLKNLPKRPPGK